MIVTILLISNYLIDRIDVIKPIVEVKSISESIMSSQNKRHGREISDNNTNEEWTSVTIASKDNKVSGFDIEPVIMEENIADLEMSSPHSSHITGIMTITRANREMSERYQTTEEIEQTISRLLNGEDIDNADGYYDENGEFRLKKCDECGGPKLGHIDNDSENRCKYMKGENSVKWSDEEITETEENISKVSNFREAKLYWDRRKFSVQCFKPKCFTGNNSLELLRHLKSTHNYTDKAIEDKFGTYKSDNSKSEVKDDIISTEIEEKLISPEVIHIISAQNKLFVDAMANMFKHDKEKNKTVHFTKPRDIPQWNRDMRYIGRISITGQQHMNN